MVPHHSLGARVIRLDLKMSKQKDGEAQLMRDNFTKRTKFVEQLCSNKADRKAPESGPSPFHRSIDFGNPSTLYKEPEDRSPTFKGRMQNASGKKGGLTGLVNLIVLAMLGEVNNRLEKVIDETRPRRCVLHVEAKSSKGHR